MSRSDRREYTPLVLAALAALLFIFAGLANQNQNTRRADRAATQEYEQTKGVVPMGASPQGQYTDPKAYREEWRAERDLNAQRDMAFWAKSLFWPL
jgi:hypothetical protein